VARYREALAEAGKPADRPAVAINRLCFLAPTDEQALREGRQYVSAVLKRYASGGALSERPDDPDILDRVLGQVALVGSPGTVRQYMREYAAAGVTRFELRVAPGDMPSELTAQTIRLAGEQLLPDFR
jgi:alkanesulfonate monooxygenase SsuD/methylene tetrahydromethanopterin reductase-like flavin-dependent oxidoreductase (luciferase family)